MATIAMVLFPGKRYQGWVLSDPADWPIEMVRQVRNEIHDRAQELVEEIVAAWQLQPERVS